MSITSYIITGLLCLWSCMVHAQAPGISRGPLAAATAHSTTHTGEEALLSNPAGIYTISRTVVSFTARNQFGEPAFSTLQAIAALPVSFGVLEFSGSRFGDAIFGVDRVSVGVGKRMGVAALGARLHAFRYHTENAGSRMVVVAEAGGIAHLSETLSIGATILNPGQARLSENEYFPTLLNLGISYMPLSTVKVMAEVEKDITREANYRFGMQYEVSAAVKAHLAVQTEGYLLAGGVSFSQKDLSLAYAATWHGLPGMGHQLCITYRLGN